VLSKEGTLQGGSTEGGAWSNRQGRGCDVVTPRLAGTLLFIHFLRQGRKKRDGLTVVQQVCKLGSQTHDAALWLIQKSPNWY
jgi:hypothetical protein